MIVEDRATEGRQEVEKPPKPCGLPVREQNIPAWLRERAYWVVWRYEWRDAKGKKPGGWTKVLYIPGTDRKAKSNDPKTWRSFEQALQAYHRGGFDGIGFVLEPGARLLGLDLDKCLDPATSKPYPWAQPIVEKVLGGYGEVSPSGTGLKFIVAGDTMPTEKTGGNFRRLPRDWETNSGAAVELYHERKFFTITGHVFADSRGALEDCGAALRALFVELDSHRQLSKQKSQNSPPWKPSGLPRADDQMLIDKALSAKNGAKFRALWSGDTSAYDGDESAADQALCNLLTFWAGPDPERIDGLFRQSGLVRDKWTGREDYRRQTIETAISGCREFYPWNGDGRVASQPSHSPSALTARGRTDVANSERYVCSFGDSMRWCEPWSNWVTFDGARWSQDVMKIATANGKTIWKQIIVETTGPHDG